MLRRTPLKLHAHGTDHFTGLERFTTSHSRPESNWSPLKRHQCWSYLIKGTKQQIKTLHPNLQPAFNMAKRFSSQNTYSTPGDQDMLTNIFFFISCKKYICWLIFCTQDTFSFSPQRPVLHLSIFTPRSILHWLATIQFVTWFLLLH